MLNDTVPTFRFNRPRTPSPSNSLPRRPEPIKAPDLSTAAKPAESGRASAGAGSRDAVAADAERFVHKVRGSDSQPLDSAGWLQRAGLNIRKASDAQHLEAIALAYATYIRISASPLQTAIMAELETLSGRKRSRTTHDLHLIVERFVSYGGETPAERLAARKLISRDVRAIQHLETAKVLPSRVQALAATPGEGLHAWARQNAAAKRVSATPVNAIAIARRAKAEARQRALFHEVTITTRRPDGSRKGRRQFKITGVLSSEVAGLRRRLKGLEMLSAGKASTN
ncbi:hypothetical protein MKK75_19625 [Methylobacterium sp. J-030]|uniref:hypothetical protein n=1 Tax=Methylobacterium sp. J-030 TaxID=2836627 RepID=UPI001FBB62D0|nr:hypothetical protein [Methylobacterium sp. J-030]MCJ2070971.1 hypothetical protein [Methylobacterium sp. J-030]